MRRTCPVSGGPGADEIGWHRLRAQRERLGVVPPSGGLRGCDGDGAAGAELFQLHIDPGDPLKHHSHGPARLPRRLTPKQQGNGAPPAGAQDQHRRLTHARAAATGGYPTQGSRTKLVPGLEPTTADRCRQAA